MDAPTVNPAVIDALKAGDVVTLRRYFPAGYEGPARPARTFVGQLTIASLTRGSDWDGHPNWCLEGQEQAMRGAWAVGEVPGGLVTTIEPVQA